MSIQNKNSINGFNHIVEGVNIMSFGAGWAIKEAIYSFNDLLIAKDNLFIGNYHSALEDIYSAIHHSVFCAGSVYVGIALSPYYVPVLLTGASLVVLGLTETYLLDPTPINLVEEYLHA